MLHSELVAVAGDLSEADWQRLELSGDPVVNVKEPTLKAKEALA